MDGKPIQIVATGEDHTFVLKNETELSKILLDDDIRDRKVVVVSVAGAFRKGKSFVLNFFLRYMHNTFTLGKQDYDWLGDENQSLEGFGWTGGPHRHTVGILMWSHVFKIDRNGEKLAVILLDTQGIFDSKTTMKVCVGMFAMSTMLSSVQVFNLSQNIQENDLQHLQLFTEYGRLALRENKHIPFQHLWFLVRDWPNADYGYPYGSEGGAMFLGETLSPDSAHDDDMKTLRKQITNCFEQISCFLMPHPGLVVCNSKFDGKLKALDPEFKNHLRTFVPMILSPMNLVTKKILGAPVTALSLFDLFRTYIQIFNSEGSLPNPTSVFKTTAVANNETAVKSALHLYMSEMKTFVEGEIFSIKRFFEMIGQAIRGEPYKFFERTRVKHVELKARALATFDDLPKMGGAEFSVPYRSYLIDEMEKMFEKFHEPDGTLGPLEMLKRMLRILIEFLIDVFIRRIPLLVQFKN